MKEVKEKLPEEDLRKLDSKFGGHCFEIKLRDGTKRLCGCASAKDRDQWVRIFILIVQMNRLNIDARKVNPFVLEMHQKR